MSNRFVLKSEVLPTITVETVRYSDFYTTCYRINGRKIRTLQRYQSEGKAKQGHIYWSNLAWPIRTPVEIEDRGKRRWKTVVIPWRWLDPDDREDDREYYEYWGWMDYCQP